MAAFTKADFTAPFALRHKADKAPVDVTGWGLEFVVKATRASVDPLFRATTAINPAAFSIDAPAGLIAIKIAAASMDAIGAGERVFGLYRTDGGRRERIATGRLNVLEGV